MRLELLLGNITWIICTSSEQRSKWFFISKGQVTIRISVNNGCSILFQSQEWYDSQLLKVNKETVPMHTYTYIYVYIYIYRERERE